MKSVIIFLSALILLHSTEEEDCKVINETREEFINLAEKKYGLKCFGTQASFPQKLESIGAIFQLNKIISIEESREIIVNLVKEFQLIVNKNPKIAPILSQVPFTADRIDISLSLTDGKKLPPPDAFSHIFTSRGNIIFSTHDEKKSIFNQTKIYESLEDACKKTGISLPLIRSMYSEKKNSDLK